jgi:fumarate reductase flavoprotein subunit
MMFYGGNLPGINYGEELFCATSFQPLLWVNENAVRFTNEMFSEDNFSFSGNAQVKQKKVVSILTQAQMDMLENEGCIYGCGEYILRGTPLSNLWDQYDKQVAAGNEAIHKADTLDGLAQQTGLDSKALQATIDKYNGYCAAKVDLDFDKNPDYLLALEEGPYYGFDLKVGYFTTVGGLKVDTSCRVLSEQDEPISGLYAGGCDAGGLYGDTYDVVICSGSQQGWCVHSGKTAAESVVEYLK